MKLPKDQKLWASYSDERGRVKWLIASDPARITYILYRVDKGELKLIKKAKSPREFEKIIEGRV